MDISPFSQMDPGLPPGYPTECIEQVTLRDGALVTLRPIRPDDAPRLQDTFKHLSTQSIFLRFLEIFKELSDKQAKEFSTLDYQERMALVAVLPSNGDEQIIGVARYAMLGAGQPGVAESAVVVIDEYQGRGLGTILLLRLVEYARAHGVDTLLATVHHTNAPIMYFVKKSGFPAEKKMIEPGVWEVLVRLTGSAGSIG